MCDLLSGVLHANMAQRIKTVYNCMSVHRHGIVAPKHVFLQCVGLYVCVYERQREREREGESER